jgi:hypothetical protein
MVRINKKVLIQEETQVLELKTGECQQALWAQKKWSKVKKLKMDFKETILELLIMLLLAQ